VRLRILKSEAAVARAVAARVTRLVADRPSAVLGLPTGRTPVPLYAELCARHAQGRIDFSRVRTFNLDEFLGLPPTHPASYRTFMEAHLFAHVNLARRNIHFLDGTARSPEAECARYEAAIRRTGGLDLLILGIGGNGHIGFNEPARALLADTHRARLAPATRRSNAALFAGRVDRVPAEALSMGVGTILRSRAVILIATGASKRDVVRGMVSGRVTPRLPASFLQLHGDVELVLDAAAAGSLDPVGGTSK
jgi:glucosamine-6-phosphate deaminase